MQPGSSIIDIGSVWGILGGMGGGSYCAVKAALIVLTQSIAADYGAQGIRAKLVAPGVVRTDMPEGLWETGGFKRRNDELTQFNRDCSIDDSANAESLLAYDQGRYFNGPTVAPHGRWSHTKHLT